MNFDWINFLIDRRNKELESRGVIDLLDYHYKVDNVYNNLVLVDLDVDILDIERFQHVKLLNDEFIVRDIEFLPHNKDFKYKLTLILKENE